jgi:transposase
MQAPLTVGVDVAKDSLVIAYAEAASRTITFDNRRVRIRAWLSSLPKGSRIGLEATNRYHETLADQAVQMGFTVYLLNPKDTRHYFRAVGARAKTDRVDAQLIARLVERESASLHPYVPPTPAQKAVDRLLRRRSKLVAIRTTLRQSLQDLEELQSERRHLTDQLDQSIAKIDALMAAALAAEPQVQALQRRLQTIVGVGPLVSTCLANTLCRVPLRTSDAFVAFAGLDPRPDDSGNRCGKRRLSKRGPSELRRLLFNAAMALSKSTAGKPLYLHYRQRGLASTPALVAIARKLARIAFALSKSEAVFNPQTLVPA